jgi:PAS domain S-box-containing protein
MNSGRIDPIVVDEREFAVNDSFLSMLTTLIDALPVAMIFIDSQTRIIAINQEFLDVLEVRREQAIGHTVREVDPNSKFPETLLRKTADIAHKHTFRSGKTAIVHRIPIINTEGRAIYGFGMVLFDTVENFSEMVIRNQLLETTISHYKEQLSLLRSTDLGWDKIIGKSHLLLETIEIAKKAARTDSTALITGQSGTGKELFANCIHMHSLRREQPFVKVNCAAIPNELLESELFGYTEGSFTGAKKGGKIGKFELANKGSIILDEIGDMPMGMQAKILRALQEREIDRVGGSKPTPIDVRVIAATNKDLKALIAEGKFREDLYYRLNVMTIDIPPLRERTGDVKELCEFLIKKIARRIGKSEAGIAQKALRILMGFDWPGNVRELENVLERALNLADGDILPRHLPAYLTQRDRRASAGEQSLKTMLADLEKQSILRSLERHSSNKSKAAAELGISRSTLYEKM